MSSSDKSLDDEAHAILLKLAIDAVFLENTREEDAPELLKECAARIRRLIFLWFEKGARG